MARREQLIGDLGMTGSAGELENRLAIPIEAHPAHPVEDRVNRTLG